MARDSVIFLLQHLGFVINLKKCVLDPAQEISFLGLIVNSQTMALSLPAEKIGKIKDQCLRLYKASKVTLLDLTKLIGTLSSTIQAVLPARLQFRVLQQQQIVSLKQFLPHFGKADSHGKKRVVIVGQQSRTLQWPIGYTTTGTGPYSDRCIQKRLGGCMSRDQNGGSVVQEGTASTYQSAGTFSHKVCHFDICQNVENVSHTHSGRKHDSLELFAENGRDKESRTNADLKGNLGVSTWAGDHDYCRIFARISQLQGRLGISAPERFLRMETVPSSFQRNMANIGEETRNRLVCFKVIKSASKLLLLEAGSQQSWNRCSSTEMVSQKSICIPLICLDSQSTEKSRGGESPFSNNSNSNLADPKLAPRTLTSFSEKTNHFATKGRLTKGSSKPTVSSYPKSNNATSSVGCLRERLAEEGVSERASDIIISSRREGTLSNYSSVWNKWVSWCVEQNVDPVQCNVNWI